MILVTGATGTVGQHVVAELLAAGEKVRAMTRDPAKATLAKGAEVVAGDLSDAASLAAALKGVKRAYLFPLHSGVDAFVEAAKASGLERVVLLSSTAVVDGVTEQSNAIGAVHKRAEDAIERSGIAWTFVRPGQFATNAFQWVLPIRHGGVVRGPYPNAATTPIDSRDIASVAVKALLTDGHAGAKYLLTGPESLTQADQVRLIGEAIGREIRFEKIPVEVARAEMAKHVPLPIVEALFSFFAQADGITAEVLPTVEKVTGRRPHTFAEWAADNADAFR